MDIVFARETFVSGPTAVVTGSHWPADDPIVLAHPSLFTDDPRFGLCFTRRPVEAATAEQPVEQATKAPGEKRQTKRA